MGLEEAAHVLYELSRLQIGSKIAVDSLASKIGTEVQAKFEVFIKHKYKMTKTEDGSHIDFETAFSAIAALDIVNGSTTKVSDSKTILTIGKLFLTTHKMVPQSIDYERAYYLQNLFARYDGVHNDAQFTDLAK